MNLHSQLISSNGSGSFGGQGGLDFFLLTLRKQREKKTHTHTHTNTHFFFFFKRDQECSEVQSKRSKAKQRKMMKLRQTSLKEKKRAAAANKQERGSFWGLAKNRVTLVQGQLQHMSAKYINK